MNPARSIGPALVKQNCTALWVYILGPIIGALAGGGAYNLLRFTDKSLAELTGATSSFFKPNIATSN